MSSRVAGHWLGKNGFARLFRTRLEREGKAGFLAVGGGAGDGADLDGLVIRRVNARQELGGFVLFPGGDGAAELLLQTAQLGLDAGIVEIFALAIAHPARG